MTTFHSTVSGDPLVRRPSTSSAQSDASTSMIERLRQHSALFLDRAVANERAGRLEAEVLQALIDVGAIHAMVPTSLGGSELDAIDTLRVIESLAEVDASTAWVTMATGFCTAAAAAYLPDSAVQRIFQPQRSGVIAGAGAPTGIARTVPGGFIVTGHWRYGSGILHADWAHCGTIVEVDGTKQNNVDGSPMTRMCYIPMNQVRLGGNWDVIGLCATGSVDFYVDGAFVGEEFTCSAAAPVHRRGSLLFRHSFTLATYIGHSAWALGCARRLMDELARYVRVQGQRPTSIAGNHGFQERYAHYEALLLSARSFIYACWNNAQDRARAGEMLDTRDITLIRLALVHVTEIAADIATFAFRIAGGETLRQGTLQRLCRDIQAGCQHMTSSPPVKQACGRVLAGLADDEVWMTNGLVKGIRRTID
jgi:indole-3-acetate monooxygenase